MRKTRNILMTEFVAFISIAVFVVSLYECDILIGGVLAAEKNAEFVIAAVMELVTLAAIPLTLRMFKLSNVKRSIGNTGSLGLCKWGTVRIFLLGLPLVLNTILYYLFMSTTFGYMAIIVLLCFPFIFPSMGRCNYEVSIFGKQE